MTPEVVSHRAWRRNARTVLVVVLACFSLSFVFVEVIRSAGARASLGVGANLETLVIEDLDPRAMAAGLRLGDRLDFNVMPYDARYRYYDLTDRSQPAGTQTTLRVIRDAKPRSFRSTWFSVPADSGADLVEDFCVLLITTLWVSIGAFLVLMRPTRMIWGFYLYCVGLQPDFVCGFYANPWLATILIVASTAIHALGFAGLFVFAARFPHDRADGGWRTLERFAVVIFTLEFVSGLYYYVPLMSRMPVRDLTSANGIVEELFYAAIFIALCTKLLRLRGSERASMSWVVAGFAIGTGVVQGLGFFVDRQSADWAELPLLLLSAAFPVAVAYAVLRRRAFALGFVANRFLVYGLFLVVVGVLFVSADWLLSAKLALTSLWLGVELTAALGLGMLLQAQHGRAVRLIDRLFLPHRYAAAESLDKIRDAMRRDSRESGENVVTHVARALDLTSVAFFRRAPDGGFLRQASCGWPDGSAWHLLPDDALCRTLTSGSKTVTLSEGDAREVALPNAGARPALAIAVCRRGLVEGAVLVGTRTSGAALDRDQARGVADVFGAFIAT